MKEMSERNMIVKYEGLYDFQKRSILQCYHFDVQASKLLYYTYLIGVCYVVTYLYVLWTLCLK